MTHKCPVEGCRAMVESNKLMCYWHWRAVPPTLQQEVYRTWNKGVVTVDYLSVREQAVCAAQTKEARVRRMVGG